MEECGLLLSMAFLLSLMGIQFAFQNLCQATGVHCLLHPS